MNHFPNINQTGNKQLSPNHVNINAFHQPTGASVGGWNQMNQIPVSQMRVAPTPNMQPWNYVNQLSTPPSSQFFMNKLMQPKPMDKHERYKMEQQQKFKELGNNFKRTTMESMLSGIVDTSQQDHSKHKTETLLATNDDFGEFLQATPMSKANEGVHSPGDYVTDKATQQLQSASAISTGTNLQTLIPSDSVTIKATQQLQSVAGISTGTDLQSKLMSSLDLNASQPKYMNFKPLQHVEKRIPNKTFQSSAKAANWSALNVADDEFYSHVDQPIQPVKPLHQPSDAFSHASPTWLSDFSQLPMIYKQVFEACLAADGLVDTSNIHRILLLSKLSNETLGTLWSIANRTMPGRLNQRELYILLALIALTQGNQEIPSLDAVLSLPCAPIPALDNSSQVCNSANDTMNFQHNPMSDLEKSHNNQQSGFDEFQDFQSANAQPEMFNVANNPAMSNNKLPVAKDYFNASLEVPVTSDYATSTSLSSLNLPQISSASPNYSIGDLKSDTISTNVANKQFPTSFIDTSHNTQPMDFLGKEDKYAAFQDLSIQTDFESTTLAMASVESTKPVYSGSDLFSSLPNPGNYKEEPDTMTSNLRDINTLSSDSFAHFQQSQDSFTGFVGTQTEVTSGVSNSTLDDFGSFCGNASQNVSTTNLPTPPVSFSSTLSSPVSAIQHLSIASDEAMKNTAVPLDSNSVKSLDFSSTIHPIVHPSPKKDEVVNHSVKQVDSIDDDDFDDNFKPPSDSGSDSFGEFDDYQEGKSTLTGFDVFEGFNETLENNRGFNFVRKDIFHDVKEVTPHVSPKMVDHSVVEAVVEDLPEKVFDHTPVRKAFCGNDEYADDKPARNNGVLIQSHITVVADNYSTIAQNSDNFVAESTSIETTGFNWKLDDASAGKDSPYIETWEKSLLTILDIISAANTIFNSIASPSVCHEVVNSIKGQRYISDLEEIYGVGQRLCCSMRQMKIEKDSLQHLHKQIELAWNNLLSFCPNPSFKEYSQAEKSGDVVCGMCLSCVEGNLIHYAGVAYHATCANFWVNCVASVLPALRSP